VSVDLKPDEWNLLDQFRALVRDESMRDESIEKFFDYEIRRRFGEAISRAGRKREQTFPLASENDYVELAQAHLLPLRKKV
jgi:hypothetical protein